MKLRTARVQQGRGVRGAPDTSDAPRRGRGARAAGRERLGALEPAESATTIRLETRTTLLTDGPFVDSKEFLGGVILIEADNLDGTLAVAAELQELDITAAIEVRPVFEQELGGA